MRTAKRIMLAVFLFLIASAFTFRPTPKLVPQLPSIWDNAAAPPYQDESDWEKIIRSAYKTIGITEVLINSDAVFDGIGGLGVDKAKICVVGFSIHRKKWERITKDEYVFTDTTYRSYPAQLISMINIYGQEYGKSISWKMNGLYFIATHLSDNPPHSGTVEDLLAYADVLYNAATGSSGSSAPQPANPPADALRGCELQEQLLQRG